MRSTCLRLGAFVIGFAAVLSSVGAARTDRHVILITIDGCPNYFLRDPDASLPTLRELAKQGAVAEQGMRIAEPAVTWPGHTTLVTGVYGDKHSVFYNGEAIRQKDGLPVRIEPRRDKSRLVAVPTLYDIAHQAGLRTAGINWPCTRNADTLDDSFPDVPDHITHTTPLLRGELIARGILKDTTNASFRDVSWTAQDRVWSEAVAHLLKTRPPNLLLFHILIVDSFHHRYGPQSQAGYAALAIADIEIRDLLRTLDETGLRDKTTVIVTSDHGFESANKLIKPNVLLRQRGYLTANVLSVGKVKAQAIPHGGTAWVYLVNPETHQQDMADLVPLFKAQEGIADVITPDRFASMHLPDPAKNPQMGDLILVAKEEYAFDGSALGDELVSRAVLGRDNVGYHGYLATNPRMNSIFIAAGAGIRPGIIPSLQTVDVAPTIARLLGIEISGIDGRVLDEILK